MTDLHIYYTDVSTMIEAFDTTLYIVPLDTF